MDEFPDLGGLSDQELKDLVRRLRKDEHEISYRRRMLRATRPSLGRSPFRAYPQKTKTK